MPHARTRLGGSLRPAAHGSAPAMEPSPIVNAGGATGPTPAPCGTNIMAAPRRSPLRISWIANRLLSHATTKPTPARR